MSSPLQPAVLFDVDGTLLDTNYLHVLAWWRGFRDTGHRDVTMADIHRAIGIASDELVTRLLGHEDEDAIEAHSQRFTELRDQVVALPGAGDLVIACADRGLAAVIATSGGKADLEWMLDAIGAGDAVTGTVTSEDVESSKPDPDLLSVAVERHRLDPDATVVLGDTVWDVEAAAKAGLPCLAVTCGGISAAELEDAGAVEVYDGPQQLLDGIDASRIARLGS